MNKMKHMHLDYIFLAAIILSALVLFTGCHSELTDEVPGMSEDAVEADGGTVLPDEDEVPEEKTPEELKEEEDAALHSRPRTETLSEFDRASYNEEGRMIQPTVEDNNWFKALTVRYTLPFGQLTTAENYEKIIRQFDVTNGNTRATVKGWYEHTAHDHRKYTYCNYYARDIAYAMGAYLPNVAACTVCGKPAASGASFNSAYTNNEGRNASLAGQKHPLFIALQAAGYVCTCENPQITDLDANNMARWLEKFGSDFGWKKIPEKEAQSWADDGFLTIGIIDNTGDIGHVFVVYPDNQNKGGDGIIYISQAGASLFEYEPKPETYTGYTYWINTGFSAEEQG